MTLAFATGDPAGVGPAVSVVVTGAGVGSGTVAMKFSEGKIPGVYVVELERKNDARGWFARSWCAFSSRYRIAKNFWARGSSRA